ncbi:MAG: DUF1904 domain-containing protein [Bacilli bacterium]|jgi:hypothetical protein|nr:DUF1904 domain-containing protein [Bacilli bacterium]
MPHIKITQLNNEEVLSLSKEVLDDIVRVTNTPQHIIKFYATNTSIILNNEINNDCILVEVLWFNRPLTMKDEVAKILHNALLKRGFKEILIYFSDINGENYYNNLDNSKR